MKAFFDHIRPTFGKLTPGQVSGIEQIVAYGQRANTQRLHLAYVLATVFHETARWMQPIREGGMRLGPATTDAQAKAAVTAIYNKGIIKRNYALPAGPLGQSYYGRGLVQITWYENYLKFQELLGVPLVADPDRALEWPVALDILFVGMASGLFRKGHSLDMIRSTDDFVAARAIVNGDKTKNGKAVADVATVFYTALGLLVPAAPVIEEKPDVPSSDPSGPKRRIAPAWWPFPTS